MTIGNPENVDMGDMAIATRVSQDRRHLSRFPMMVNCRFKCRGKSYEAVILDLSMNGAFISGRFLPAKNEDITLSIGFPGMTDPLVLDARVTRVGSCISDHGTLSRFGVNFRRVSTELIPVIKSLTSRYDLKSRAAGGQHSHKP